ncbi:MAG: 1-aminocyclopropane-1-carboxylate deaminase [Nevskiales bacterium]
MSAGALEAAFPALADTLPHIVLGALPTPVADTPALARALGVAALVVKRDDLTSPVYGGNKVRKLEYLLADALASGCDTIVTFGTAGSNHALAASLFAGRLGLACHAVLLDQVITPWVADSLRHHLLLGTRLHPARSYNHSLELAARIRERHPGGAQRVYEIPWGGSNWRGAVGFVGAALEFAGQCASGEEPEYLYVAGGTMGTAIGLTLGLRVAGLATRVVAPRVVPFGDGANSRVAALLAETNRALHDRDRCFPLLDEPMRTLELREEFLGDGYAQATPASLEAVAMMRELAGIRLETTYTAKALAALIADARSGRLAGRRVVFWNTYNSAPYPAGIAEVDLTALPEPLARYLRTAAR